MSDDCVRITGGKSAWRQAPSCVISDGNYGNDLFRIERPPR